MITKQVTEDHHITENRMIEVRTITRLFEDGKEINKTYHRHVVSPIDNLEGETELTKSIAKAILEPTVIEDFARMQEESIRKATGRPSIAEENELNQRKAELEDIEATFLANLQAYETEFKRQLEEATADGYVNEEEKKGLWDTIKSWF